jgi:hypothetical protein
MEKIKKFPNSIRKFIRTQKAQIRRQFWDVKKQSEEITEMYAKLAGTSVRVVAAPEPKKVAKPKVKKEKVKSNSKK